MKEQPRRERVTRGELTEKLIRLRDWLPLSKMDDRAALADAVNLITESDQILSSLAEELERRAEEARRRARAADEDGKGPRHPTVQGELGCSTAFTEAAALIRERGESTNG